MSSAYGERLPKALAGFFNLVAQSRLDEASSLIGALVEALDRDFAGSYSDFRPVRRAEMCRTQINYFAFIYRFSFREADWRMRAREAIDT